MVFCLVFGVSCLCADELPHAALIENSPFLPPNYKQRAPSKPAPSQTPKLTLELRGMFELNGEWTFSFFDTKQNKSFWIKPNDPQSKIKILSFDPERYTVTIDNAGMPETIMLKKPSAPTGRAPIKGKPQPNKPASKAEAPTEDDMLKLLEDLFLLDAAANKNQKQLDVRP